MPHNVNNVLILLCWIQQNSADVYSHPSEKPHVNIIQGARGTLDCPNAEMGNYYLLLQTLIVLDPPLRLMKGQLL